MSNHGRSTNTKAWNTNLDTVDADENLYTDYRDDTKQHVCNLKFKTTLERLVTWIRVHKEYYGHTVTSEVKSPRYLYLVTATIF